MESPDDFSDDRETDEQHLNLLAIFHYILGGLGALSGCFPLLYVILGAVMLTNPNFFDAPNPPPPEIGYFFIAFGGLFAVIGWTIAFATIVSGRKIAHRRGRTFSIVIAAILCLFMPFGTLLGVFTIVVLSRKSVQQLYAERD